MILAKTLDDPLLALRHDPHTLSDGDDHEYQDRKHHDQAFTHSLLPAVQAFVTLRKLPSTDTTLIRSPAEMASSAIQTHSSEPSNGF